MAPQIEYTRLKYIAETGTTKDVENLLRAYGDLGTTNPKYSCLDWIEAGVRNSNTATHAEKKALVAAYVAKTGVFSEDGAMTPDAAQQVQETLIQLLETVQELTGQVQALRGEVKELKKTAEEKPATPQRSFPSIH